MTPSDPQQILNRIKARADGVPELDELPADIDRLTKALEEVLNVADELEEAAKVNTRRFESGRGEAYSRLALSQWQTRDDLRRAVDKLNEEGT